MERTYGAAYFNLGISGLDGLDDHKETLFEHGRYDIFIAYAYIFKVERRRMTGIGSHLCPLAGSGIAIGPFYHIQYLLTVGGHLRHRDTSLLSSETIFVGS